MQINPSSKQYHQLYLPRCLGLTYNLSQKCLLVHSEIIKPTFSNNKVPKHKSFRKKQLAFDKKTHIYFIC